MLCRDAHKRYSITKFRHPQTKQWFEYSTNEVYDRLSCKDYFNKFDIFCDALNNAHLFIRNYKREYEKLIVVEMFAMCCLPFYWVLSMFERPAPRRR